MGGVRPASLAGRQPLRAVLSLLVDLFGPGIRGTGHSEARSANNTWIALLCINASIGLLLIAAGHGAGRREADYAPLLFWSGMIALLLPTAARAAWPEVSRGERVFLLLLLSEALFLYKLLYSPTGMVQFDEMLHWITANDIMRHGRLFLDNPLLPVSPSYPGIEILTTALANLTGLTVFWASNAVIAILRVVFTIALFLFFDKLIASPRAAAVGTLIYMGCANFAIFDAMFAYETQGLALAMLAMLAEADAARRGQKHVRGALALIAILLASLAITHHLSAGFCALYMVGLLGVELLRRDDRVPTCYRLAVVAPAAAMAILLPLLWVYAIGVPISDYIGPVVNRGVTELVSKLNGTSEARQMFVAADGTQQAIGYRLAGIGATLLIAAALATGFFRALAASAPDNSGSGWQRLADVLRRRWADSRLVVLTIATFGFPISVAFRLTSAGWEIGNRMGSFVFVAVGFVAAVSIIHFWQARPNTWNRVGVSLAVAVILLGGITTGSAGRAIRGSYRVSADPESIEPMGIGTALWTKKWLGTDNRFGADRVNRSLLATYGQQDIVTSIEHSIDVSRTFLDPKLTPDAIYPIRRGNIEYLLADLRLTTALAVLGEYYERRELTHGRPPPPASLLKFDQSGRVARIYDNGWIVIYDVTGLHADE